MSCFLLYTSPARGHLYPMMDVAVALREAGHRVVVQTLAGERSQVTGAGLEHRPIAPAIEALTLRDYEGGSPIDQFKRTFGCWLERAPHEALDLRRALDEVAPDLVLVDANTWGAAALAESLGRPWSMFLPYCLPVPSRDAPAFGPGFPPPAGWAGRLRDRAVWAVLGFAARGHLSGLNALRARLGAPALPSLWSLYQRAPLLLYRTSEPFDYARSDMPRGVAAIGPGLWAPAGEAPAWIDELPAPRVLVSVSTELQEDGPIIAAALEGLADEPVSVIVTTASLDPARFAAPTPRVRIVRFLPHAAVIPKVDVVVTHGGMGTTQRALAAGVPLVVVPWGRDQNESARRVAVCGAGAVVPRKRLNAGTLRAAVRQAMSRAPAARRVAEGFRAAGGAARAVTLLEGQLAN